MAVTVQNIVGTGSLGVELNLDSLLADLDVAEKKYDPSFYPGAYLRLEDDGPLITVYRTGKYIISGGTSVEELHQVRDQLLDRLANLGVVSSDVREAFSVSNVVGTADIGRELDLNALTIGLGLENAEYEPEQFPGLIYRPEGYNCVVLMFRSGKVVVTGANSVEVAEETFEAVKEQVEELFGEVT